MKTIKLLNCAQCGANPKEFCEIKIIRDSLNVSDIKQFVAKCKKCNYTVAVLTDRKNAIIKKLWNIRIV